MSSLLCPLRFGPFEAGAFVQSFLAGRGADSHECIEFHGGAEGVHSEAWRARNAGRVDLPQGRDQPGGVFQLEEEVWRLEVVAMIQGR